MIDHIINLHNLNVSAVLFFLGKYSVLIGGLGSKKVLHSTGTLDPAFENKNRKNPRGGHRANFLEILRDEHLRRSLTHISVRKPFWKIMQCGMSIPGDLSFTTADI